MEKKYAELKTSRQTETELEKLLDKQFGFIGTVTRGATAGTPKTLPATTA